MSGFRQGFTGALIAMAAIAAAGCVSSPAVAQRGYYETSPMFHDDFIFRSPPQRRSHPHQGYYPQQGYYPDQGFQEPYRRDRGYYHQPRQRYAPEPRFYDKEAAKDYWRAQKEAQKRAIKRGYYNQPQSFPQQGFGGHGGGFGGGAPYRRGGAGATALD